MKILVVDDEPVARQRVLRVLASIPDIEVVGEADSAKGAIASVQSLAPDVLILDIEMPGIDGLGLASLLDGPAIIFLTAHSERALAAFEVGAHDYLVKPVNKDRLEASLARVRSRLVDPPSVSSETASTPWRLTVTDGSLKRFVDARDVECFSADDKYISFTLAGRQLLLRDSLDALEERLASYGFVRANRAALVRVAAVSALDVSDGGTLVLASGDRVPVSRRAQAAVRQALGMK